MNARIPRRIVTISAVTLTAFLLAALAPIWIPVSVTVDLIKLKERLPTTRLLCFALWWSWLELAGLTGAFGLFLGGQGRNLGAHYRLQKWWALKLMTALTKTTGLSVTCENADVLADGPLVLLSRHASLADSLVSAWAIVSNGMQPSYVLKKELLADPCLDVFGNRLPNYFLDRNAADSAGELEAIGRLGQSVTSSRVAVIFPEGTRSNPAKRERALIKIGERDQERADRLRALTHLLPPRPAGTLALIGGAADADVVVAWHVGFDGLDTFGGIRRHLASIPPPVKFVLRRIPRSAIPATAHELERWLDGVWLDSDAMVRQTLNSPPYLTTKAKP